MPLTYYSRAATEEFWSEHWRGHSLEALTREALTSPLTALILRALPPRGTRVLEAGCGLGQYVLVLRQRGYRVIGADWSLDALRACRAAAPGTPMTVMDLRQLGFRPGTFAAYVSLGVAEHDPAGPDAILRDAWRVLEPGGLLILSVPYVNVVRRLGAWWIRRRTDRVREDGGQFYQFAFSGSEAQAFVERGGFRVLSAVPYDPGRVIRGAWRTLTRRVRIAGGGRARPAPEPPAPGTPAQGGIDGVRGERTSPRAMVLSSAARKALRALLYTRAALHTFGHMILVVAVRP